MKCVYCGKSVADGAVRCPSCQNTLNGANHRTAPAGGSGVFADAAPDATVGNGKNRISFIGPRCPFVPKILSTIHIRIDGKHIGAVSKRERLDYMTDDDDVAVELFAVQFGKECRTSAYTLHCGPINILLLGFNRLTGFTTARRAPAL